MTNGPPENHNSFTTLRKTFYRHVIAPVADENGQLEQQKKALGREKHAARATQIASDAGSPTTRATRPETKKRNAGSIAAPPRPVSFGSLNHDDRENGVN